MGPSIKDVRSQRGVVQCGQEGRRFFRCGHPHFLGQKISDFLKFMVCPHGQEGKGGEVEPVRAMGEGDAILCGCLL